MYGLKMQNNQFVVIANRFEFGVFDEPIEKWAAYDENDNVIIYVMPFDEMTVVEIKADIPEDYDSSKYLYIDDEFVLNPEWVEPPMPVEIVVKGLSEEVDLHSECLDEVAEIIVEDESEIQVASECLDEAAECISDLYDLIAELQVEIEELKKVR